MGGEGSGRKPDPMVSLKREAEKRQAIAASMQNQVLLPNYSGVENFARKDKPDNVVAGGSNKQVQYNDAGFLNGITQFLFDNSLNTFNYTPLNTNGQFFLQEPVSSAYPFFQVVDFNSGGTLVVGSSIGYGAYINNTLRLCSDGFYLGNGDNYFQNDTTNLKMQSTVQIRIGDVDGVNNAAMITIDDSTQKAEIINITKLNIQTLPTSSAGLSTGDVWVDTAGGLNILKIV